MYPEFWSKTPRHHALIAAAWRLRLRASHVANIIYTKNPFALPLSSVTLAAAHRHSNNGAEQYCGCPRFPPPSSRLASGISPRHWQSADQEGNKETAAHGTSFKIEYGGPGANWLQPNLRHIIAAKKKEIASGG